MRSIKKRIVFFILSFMAICFYILSIHQMHKFEQKLQNVTFVSKDESGLAVSPSGNVQNGVFWRADEGVTIENHTLNRMAEAIVFSLHGRSDYLLKSTWILDTESKNSCIISSGLSYELFGNIETEGFELQYNNRSYEVVDVIKEKENLFFYEPASVDEISYERYTQKNSENKALDVVEQELQMKLGNGVILDYTVIRLILDLFLLIIPILLWSLLVKTVYFYQKESKTIPEQALWGFILTAMIIVLLWGIVKNIHVPMDMIPDQWSDFEFCADKFEEKKNAILFLIGMKKTAFEMKMIKMIWKIIGYQATALFIVFIIFRIEKKQKNLLAKKEN